MTTLFKRVRPAQKFRITKRKIAKFLGIAESLVQEVEKWPYIIYVHRLDRGGQFISYRQLCEWKNAVACQIQKCSSWEDWEKLWNAIRIDRRKHCKQYEDSLVQFWQEIWAKRSDALPSKVMVDNYTTNLAGSAIAL